MDDKRTIAWFSAFVVVVLLAGMASGILLDRFLLRPFPGPFNRGGAMPGMGGRPGPGMRPGPMGPGMGPGAMGPDGGRAGGRAPRPEALADRLAEQLQLTPAVKDKVLAILSRRRTKLDEVRKEMQDRMEREQADLRAEGIRTLLDDKQQKRFDELVATSPGLGGRPPGARRGPLGR